MPIHFLKERNQYVIETADSYYSFYNWEGQLRSAYWGEKLNHICDLPLPKLPLNSVFGQAFINRKMYNTEYVGWGSFFYAEPTLKVTFADGSRDLKLSVVSCNIENEHTFTATFKDDIYDLSIKMIYKIYDGLNIIDRNCIIYNNTGDTVTLNLAASATVTLPYRDTSYRLTSMGSNTHTEYDITRTPITKSKTVLESRSGLPNTISYPYFAIDEGAATENDGEVWFGALQWSGNGKITVELDTAKEVRITGGISDFDFGYKLENGKAFETPVFTLGYTKQGFSGASRQIHDYTRLYQYGGYWADKCLPVLYNTFWTYGIDGVEEQKLLNIVDAVADIGTELFVVDDGWYSTAYKVRSGLGDWWPSPERFPNGLSKLIKAVNDKGMMFGIWVEPEMVTPDTELYKKHPDWVLSNPAREHEQSWNGRLILNLAMEEVYQFIVGFLDDLLSNNNIGYLKWDMNRWFTPVANPNIEPEKWQNIWVDYVKNLHRIFAHLNKKFPNVIIENCASGGLRADLSMAKYCSRINRSDNQDPVDELYLHEGFTYVNLSRAAGGAGHITKSGAGINKRDCPMDFKAHIAYMGSLSVGIDIASATKEELEQIKGYTDTHKKIRHIIQLGDMYRLVSIREKDYMAIEFVTKDKSEAVVFLFGPCKKFCEPIPDLKLYGLNPDTLYSITHSKTAFLNDGGSFELHGDTLMKLGLPHRDYLVGNMQSVMFYIKAK